MANNSKWVLDDFSTSSEDEHDNNIETGTVSSSMNQSMNNPWLNGWTITGHDNVTPVDSKLYNPTGVTNVTVTNNESCSNGVSYGNDVIYSNDVSCGNDVSYGNDVSSSNVYSNSGWSWGDIPGSDSVDETNTSACCWDSNTFPNKYPHLEEDAIDRPYVIENEGGTY